MKRLKALWLCSILVIMLSGCGQQEEKMQNGSYTAQMSDYSHGWREFVTITVKNAEIVSVQYNAENESGFIKSWDNAYMKNMKTVMGTYPNEYTRYYAAQIMGQSELPDIDVLSGASTSGGNFEKLSKVVIEQALKGDSQVVYVKSE